MFSWNRRYQFHNVNSSMSSLQMKEYDVKCRPKSLEEYIVIFKLEFLYRRLLLGSIKHKIFLIGNEVTLGGKPFVKIVFHIFLCLIICKKKKWFKGKLFLNFLYIAWHEDKVAEIYENYFLLLLSFLEFSRIDFIPLFWVFNSFLYPCFKFLIVFLVKLDFLYGRLLIRIYLEIF